MKKALIVIDVQNHFINTLTKDLPKKILKFIKQNKDNFDLIIFTRFINTTKSSVYRLLNWKESMSSPEIDIVPVLQPVLKYGVVVSKSEYSVLKVARAKKLLKKFRIQELYLCGMDTDCCVLATAFDAFDQQYRIYLLEDLCMASSNVNLHKTTLSIFKRNILPLK